MTTVCRLTYIARCAQALAGALLMCLVSAPVQAVDSINLTLNYTVIQGSCDVSVGSDGNNGTLHFGDVTYTTSVANWAPIGPVKNFSVKLTNCSGAASASTQPAITVDGTTETVLGQPNNKSYLFVDSSSVAVGFGFAIYKDQTTTTAANIVSSYSNPYQGDKTKSMIPIPGYGKNTAINGAVTVPLAAAVTCGLACGNASDKSKFRAGSVKGTVTFTFRYM